MVKPLSKRDIRILIKTAVDEQKFLETLKEELALQFQTDLLGSRWNIRELRWVQERVQKFCKDVLKSKTLDELPDDVRQIPHLGLILRDQNQLTADENKEILKGVRDAIGHSITSIDHKLKESSDAIAVYKELLKSFYTHPLAVLCKFLDGNHEKSQAILKAFSKEHPYEAKQYQESLEECGNRLDDHKKFGLKDCVNVHNILENQVKQELRTNPCFTVMDTIIDVKAPVILMSHILSILPKIQLTEVTITGVEAIFIDCNLENEQWNGRNIILKSKHIECLYNGIVWDVSGLNAAPNNVSSPVCGREDGQDGAEGPYGLPGKSGGNGAFVAKEFVHMGRLTFVCNGGNGTDGQDGGNGARGKDGINGDTISMDKLLEAFPSPARLIGFQRTTALKTTFTNLRNYISNPEVNGGSNCKGINPSTGEEDHTFGTTVCHIRGHTTSGLQIEFGYYTNERVAKRQAFLLVKGGQGTTGMQGGLGGQGGAGGKGGWKGDLNMFLFNGQKVPKEEQCYLVAKNGKDGEDGKDGMDGPRGKNGRNGEDFGYMDISWWRNIVFLGPKTLEIITYQEPPETCVWSDHYSSYVAIAPARSSRPLTCMQIDRQKVSNVKQKIIASKTKAIDMTSLFDDLSTEVSKNLPADALNDLIDAFDCGKFLKSSTLCVDAAKNENLQNMNYIRTPAVLTMRKKIKKIATYVAEFFITNVEKQTAQDIVLIKERIEACERIVESRKLEILLQSDVEKFVICPTSTRGGLSAIHALLGQDSDSGIYENNVSREDFFNATKKLIKPDFENDFQDSLKARFEDFRCQDKTTFKIVALSFPELKKLYQHYLKDSSIISQMSTFDNRKILEEYFDILSQPLTTFLPSDLYLIASIYQINLKIFQKQPHLSTFLPVDETEASSAHTFIAYDSKFQYFRLKKVTRRKQTEINKRIDRILWNIWTFTEPNQIHKYAAKDKFMKQGDTKNSAVMSRNSVVQLDRINGLASIIFSTNSAYAEPDEKFQKLQITSSLLTWPPAYVNILYDKIYFEKQAPSSLQSLIMKLTEKLETSPSEATSFMWALTLKPVMQWNIEYTAFFLEEYFESASTMELETWKTILMKLPTQLTEEIRKLLEQQTAFGTHDSRGFSKWLTNLPEEIGESKIADKEFGEFAKNTDFSKLSGLSRSQWKFQLCRLRLEWKLTNLKNVNWETNTNNHMHCMYYLNALHNENGEIVEQLLELLGKNPGTTPGRDIVTILSNFYGGLWNLNYGVEKLRHENSIVVWKRTLEECNPRPNFWQQIQNNKTNTVEKQTVEILIKQLQDNKNNTVEKQTVEILIKQLETLCYQTAITDISSHEWLQNFKHKSKGKSLNLSTTDLQIEAVAQIDRVIKNQLGYNLREPQKFAILAALYVSQRSDEDGAAMWSLASAKKNLLAQIATGEGKTMIVIAIAIVRGLFGEKTDVVTSSSVLAQRDANEYRKIFDSFGITVADVTSDIISTRRMAYRCDVCYGEVSHFQRDFLLDTFYGHNIRGNREHEGLIVDEVDSMFLDKANSVLYLSHQPPDFSSLEELFVAIWANVVQLIKEDNFNKESLTNNVLNKIYPSLDYDDMRLFTLDYGDAQEILEFLQEHSKLSPRGFVTASFEEIEKDLLLLPTHLKKYSTNLAYLLKKKFAMPDRIHIMKHLQKFVTRHLETWIISAYRACQMREGEEYVVDVSHSKVELDNNSKIIIVDLDTGIDLKHSQWSDGLHQFLQLKHGCSLTLLNLKAVFISNIRYYKEYKTLFGLTGTIGTEADRQFLQNNYNTYLICVPLAQPKQFVEEEPIVCAAFKTWREEIHKDITSKIEQNRSVLVICETVQEAESMFTFLKALIRENVHLYRRDYEDFRSALCADGLESGRVLIATNLAGRGTDIKLTDNLRNANGLHVILSYLPDNLRVEQQAFGRAARSGDPGSGRLIFLNKYSTESSENYDAIDTKMMRDEMEMQKVSDIELYYRSVIQKEENKFLEFQTSFDIINGLLENIFEAFFQKTDKDPKFHTSWDSDFKCIKDIFRYSLLDDWAFWLDRYTGHLLKNYEICEMGIRGVISTDNHLNAFDVDLLTQEFNEICESYKNKLSQYKKPSWLEKCKARISVTSSNILFRAYPLDLVKEPALRIKVAKAMIKKGLLTEADEIFSKILHDDNQNLPAMYYKLFCAIKQNKSNWNTEEISNLHKMVDELIQQYKLQQLANTTSIEQFKTLGTQQLFVGDGYRKQKEIVSQLFSVHQESINSILGPRKLEAEDFKKLCKKLMGAPTEEDLSTVTHNLLAYLVQNQIVLSPTLIWNDNPENIAKLIEPFCLSESKTRNAFGSFKNKPLEQIQTQIDLQKTLDIPWRTGFWEEIKNCIDEIHGFVVILDEQLLCSSNKDCQNEIKNWARTSSGRPYISKFGTNWENLTKFSIDFGRKRQFENNPIYQWLYNNGKICYEECGFVNLEKLSKTFFLAHGNISTTDFTFIDGITEEKSENIFKILKAEEVIGVHGELMCLEKLNQLSDTALGDSFRIYKNDILQALKSKCRYSYEKLLIVKQITETSKTHDNNQSFLRSEHVPDHDNKDICKELQVTLPSNPVSDFINLAIELGFVTGFQANPEYFTQGIYSKAKQLATKALGIGQKDKYFSKTQVEKRFPNFDPELTNEIINDLVKRGWLVKKGTQPAEPSLDDDEEEPGDEETSEDEETSKDEEATSTSYFSKFENLVNGTTEQWEVKKRDFCKFRLCKKFKLLESEIKGLVQLNVLHSNPKFLETAVEMVRASQGKHVTLDNPDTRLVPMEKSLSFVSKASEEDARPKASTSKVTEFETHMLADSLEAKHNKSSKHFRLIRPEIQNLALNSFDDVAETEEQKYSIQMIAMTSFVAVVGVAQIVYATSLLVSWWGAAAAVSWWGPVAALTWILESVGDLFRVWQSCKSGYFNWKEWASQKGSRLAVKIWQTVRRVTNVAKRAFLDSSIGKKLFTFLESTFPSIFSSSGSENGAKTEAETTEDIGVLSELKAWVDNFRDFVSSNENTNTNGISGKRMKKTVSVFVKYSGTPEFCSLVNRLRTPANPTAERTLEDGLTPEDSRHISEEINPKLLKLCSQTRDAQVISYMVEQGVPLEAEILQSICMMCNIIICVRSDDHHEPKAYYPYGKKDPIHKIYLRHKNCADPSFAKTHTWCPSTHEEAGDSVPSNELLQAVLKELALINNAQTDLDLKVISDFMKSDPNFQHFISNGWHCCYNAVDNFTPCTYWKCLNITQPIDLVKTQREIFKFSTLKTTHAAKKISEWLNKSQNVDMTVYEGDNQSDINKLVVDKSYKLKLSHASDPINFPKYVQFKITPSTFFMEHSDEKLKGAPDSLTKFLQGVVENILKASTNKSATKTVELFHIVLWLIGGPSLLKNFILDDKSNNCKIGRTLMHKIVRFILENGEAATIDVGTAIKIHSNKILPLSHKSFIVFSLGRSTYRTECVEIFNDKDFEYVLSNPRLGDLSRSYEGE